MILNLVIKLLLGVKFLGRIYCKLDFVDRNGERLFSLIFIKCYY